jgi:hypothetical protein
MEMNPERYEHEYTQTNDIYKNEYIQSVCTGGYNQNIQDIMMKFPPWGYYRLKKYNIPVRISGIITSTIDDPNESDMMARIFIPMKNKIVESFNWSIDKIERLIYFSLDDLTYLSNRLDESDMLIFIDRLGPTLPRWEFMLKIKTS